MKSSTFLMSMILTLFALSSAVGAKEAAKAKEAGHGDAGHDEKSHDERQGKTGKTDEEEAGEGNKVGPDKGILEAHQDDGFKLSPEALNNFELKLVKIEGRGPWKIPGAAVVRSGEETNLYRLRDGFFKRIDFRQVSTSKEQVIFDSRDVAPGDQIVIAGVGFLRLAELSAFGGGAEGHSH